MSLLLLPCHRLPLYYYHRILPTPWQAQRISFWGFGSQRVGRCLLVGIYPWTWIVTVTTHLQIDGILSVKASAVLSETASTIPRHSLATATYTIPAISRCRLGRAIPARTLRCQRQMPQGLWRPPAICSSFTRTTPGSSPRRSKCVDSRACTTFFDGDLQRVLGQNACHFSSTVSAIRA